MKTFSTAGMGIGYGSSVQYAEGQGCFNCGSESEHPSYADSNMPFDRNHEGTGSRIGPWSSDIPVELLSMAKSAGVITAYLAQATRLLQ